MPAAVSNQPFESGRPNLSARAMELMGGTVVWDNHGCMPLRTDDSFLPQLERYRHAGVNVVSINVGFADTPLIEHVRVLSFMRRWIARRPETYQLVSSVDDVQDCKKSGKLGITFDIEGMCPVEDDLSLVQTFYELGVRWMLIAYNRSNKAGGGCLDTDGGLTATGRAIIDEMERVGMVLCLSHTGTRTAAEALAYSRNPVIFSHSNAYRVHAHPRNIPDELMRACAAKGGVIGINGIGSFLGSGEDLVNQFLSHLHYAVDLVGAEHVGLGLDCVFDRAEADEDRSRNPTLYPPGLDNRMLEPEAVGAIVEALGRSGLTDEQIRAILGENWLRIAMQVWH
jgi:membrane dipeptidase